MVNWQRNGFQAKNYFYTIPITKIVLVIWAISYISAILRIPLNDLLAFNPHQLPNAITGLITYSLVIPGASFVDGLITLIFAGYIMYQFGGSLERAWGWKYYLLFLLGASLASSIVWLVGMYLFQVDFPKLLATPWYLVAALVVAWALVNADETVRLWFILPIPAIWIAWLTIAMLYFSAISAAPAPRGVLLGFCSLGGIAFVYGMQWYHRKWAWIPRRKAKASPPSRPLHHPSSGLFGTLLRPYRDWQRRRRLAKLQRTIKFDD